MTPEISALVSICSAISIIYGAYKIVNAPLKKIEKNKEDIEALQKKQQNQKEIDKAILNGLFSLVNHIVDGNGMDSLKSSRDELMKAINDIAVK